MKDDQLYRALGMACALSMKEDDRRMVPLAAIQRDGWLFSDDPDTHELLEGLAYLAAVYIKSFAKGGSPIETWAPLGVNAKVSGDQPS